jgi:adenosylcobinamide-GDP ribazoletransferase
MIQPRRYLAQAQLALMLLTRLPAGYLPAPAPSMAQARWAFALVGLVVGALGWAAQHGALGLGLSPMVGAWLALGVMALVTGALHHDGLADYADGMGGGRDRAHVLEIMRDSRIGSYGVLALVLVLALMASALASFPAGAPLAVFLFAATGSRLSMTLVLALLPPARPDGLGQSAAGARGWGWLWPGALVLVLLGLGLGLAALVALVVMGLAAFLAARVAMARVGGQTGDVLGAVQMLSEMAALLVLAAMLG